MADADDLLYRLVGNRIRAAREAVRPRLSQKRLADRLGMSRVSIVNIEKGRQHPPVHVLWSLARELDVELTSFFPSSAEHQHALEPVRLDEEAVATIEAAANGDASVRESLMEFIGRARAQLGTLGANHEQD